jgi:type IV pilus assembly protein PilB
VLNQNDFVLTVLTQEGTLRPADAERAARHAAEQRLTVPDAAAAIGAITPRQLAIARATVAECAYVNIEHYEIDLRNAALLPRSAAEKHVAFPLFNTGRVITIGMADPLDLPGVDRLRQLLKAEIETVLCEPEQVRALIDRAYAMGVGARETPSAIEAVSSGVGGDEPIVAAVNQIISRAIQEGASDVHLGPDERELHLRHRIDGVLQTRQGPPLSSHPGLVQRLKVMADLDLTQSRRPQDGKFRFVHAGKNVDIRVSIIPTITGENVVLRILAGGGAIGSLADLGFPADIKGRVEEILEHPHGMILVTGPTGSGKTTTLYSFISRLNTPELNIVTIEDPVEIRLPLVRQVQVHAEIGMTFAGALRSILRQDPDIVLLGEIRDEETARIAVQAALTGHLVLSTLHTNDAPGAIARLRDFGVPGFAINASVLGVLAQRLVRRVCPDCAKPYEPAPALIRKFIDRPEKAAFRKGAGCPKCLGTGSRGRVGIYELLDLSQEIQGVIESGASTSAVRAAAVRAGMRPMWMDGLEKACVGMTTLEEIATVAAGSIAEDRASLTNPGMRLSA